MSREILYRAKTIKDNEWVQGAYCHYDDIKDDGKDDCDYIIEKHNGEYFPFREIIPETVGQFTGLTDKNGKKIFEGDIVKGYFGYGDDENDIAYIEYQEDSMGFVLVEILKEDYGKLFEIMGEVEVIGNIHDNPELMEKTK